MLGWIQLAPGLAACGAHLHLPASDRYDFPHLGGTHWGVSCLDSKLTFCQGHAPGTPVTFGKLIKYEIN